MIFDVLNDIISSKRGDVLDSVEEEKEYSGYMANRWLSMYSPAYAIIINDTTNKYYNNFKTKKEQYQFLCKILPRGQKRKIDYFKKDKADVKIDEETVKFIASNMQLSMREVKDYIINGNIDIKKFSNKLK